MTTLPHSYITFLDPFHLPSTHWRICARVSEVHVYPDFAPFLTDFALLSHNSMIGMPPPPNTPMPLLLPILLTTILSYGEVLFIFPYFQHNSPFMITVMDGSHWPMPRNPIKSIIEPFNESSHIHNVLYVSEAALHTLSAVPSDIFQVPNKCICRVSISPDWCLGSQE